MNAATTSPTNLDQENGDGSDSDTNPDNFPEYQQLYLRSTTDAATTFSTNIVQENGDGSDSDTNPDESPEYYQPISVDDTDNGNNSDSNPDPNSSQGNLGNGHHTHLDFSYLHLTNGLVQAQNGMASVHIGDNAEHKNEEEEERTREASELAIQRAFREDETRRNAPLPSENAVRVMEAMQGISFSGVAPEWANQVPEDQWVDHLTRLRQPQRDTSAV